MKSAGPMIIAITLLFAAGGRAQDAATSGNPYAGIVSRNIFGLLPIPASNPADQGPPADPPPKITPNGIMTIFGKLQALFKVASKGKPGQPAKDDSYVLAEGERQDEIEVVKINQADGIVTFDNHGTRQELPLIAAANTTVPAGPGGVAAPGSGINPGLLPRQSPLLPNARAVLGGNPSGRSMNSGNPNNGGNPGGPSFGGGGSGSAISQPQNENNTLLPEERAILLEAQRAKYQQEGNPIANMLPPPSPAMQQVINRINNSGNP